MYQAEKFSFHLRTFRNFSDYLTSLVSECVCINQILRIGFDSHVLDLMCSYFAYFYNNAKVCRFCGYDDGHGRCEKYRKQLWLRESALKWWTVTEVCNLILSPNPTCVITTVEVKDLGNGQRP